MLQKLKEVRFEGNSRGVILSFPKPIRIDIGRQLFRLQEGLEPDNWKPFTMIGHGCRDPCASCVSEEIDENFAKRYRYSH